MSISKCFLTAKIKIKNVIFPSYRQIFVILVSDLYRLSYVSSFRVCLKIAQTLPNFSLCGCTVKVSWIFRKCSFKLNLHLGNSPSVEYYVVFLHSVSFILPEGFETSIRRNLILKPCLFFQFIPPSLHLQQHEYF